MKNGVKFQNRTITILCFSCNVIGTILAYSLCKKQGGEITAFDEVITTFMLLLSFFLLLKKIPDIQCDYANKTVVAECLMVIISILAFFIIEYVNGTDGQNLTVVSILINLFPIYCFVRLLMVLGCSYAVTGFVALAVAYAIGLITFFVEELRGTPLMAYDLLSISTAASVIDNYVLPLNSKSIVGICAVFTFTLLLHRCGGRVSCSAKRKAANFICVIVLFSLFFTGIVKSTSLDGWSVVNTYRESGNIYGFLSSCKEFIIEKPENYSSDYAEELLSRYNDDGTEKIVKAKNIIVIMNEAFSDLSVVSKSNELSSDNILPNYNAILGKKNTRGGYVHVSVIGGGTCNTEFEMLTGITTRFTSGYPYQFQIYNDTNSLAGVFSDKGYYSVAFHPYEKSNYRRNKVYPWLGFDTFWGIEDLNAQIMEKTDEMPTDHYCYQVIEAITSGNDKVDGESILFMDKQEEMSIPNNEAQGFFVFCVTMQNHGGYLLRNCENIYKTSVSENEEVNKYISLLMQSDKDIGDLVKYYESCPEPTMICFFGDHQPDFSAEASEYVYQDLNNCHESEYRKYITPFFIWTNYENPLREQDYNISVNYLYWMIQEASGNSDDRYGCFLKELCQYYPVISKYEIQECGDILETVSKDDMLKNYDVLQYYYLKEQPKQKNDHRMGNQIEDYPE